MQDSIYYQNFCSNVINTRKRHQLHHHEMARLMGITIAMLKSIEAGYLPRNVNMRILFRLYDGFGVSPDRWLQPDCVGDTTLLIPIRDY